MANIYTYLNTLRQKGYLAYEYNPFHNYQTAVDLYEIKTDVGWTLVPVNMAVHKKTGELLTKNNGKYYDKYQNKVIDGNYIEPSGNNSDNKLYAKAGSLIDFDTDKLNFDLEHPVDITVQPSYDGSVNLILNDDKNIPRLINSRFSTRELGTYEIVDRIGENDTNIYNSESFDKDTSLYFQYERNPIVEYKGFVKGVLPVGQYCFYFTYCDSDDNESDYIAESGLIPVFLGTDGDPKSMDGGIKNQQSDKGIRLKLTNLDKSYNYIRIYYVRYFADYQQNRVYECKKLVRRTTINSNTTYVQISGLENTESIDPNILNITRFNPKSVLAQAQCKNMLFFGNIVKNSDNYRELQDCALRITPSVITNKNFQQIDNNYVNGLGYFDSYNMSQNVGYFNQEFYRFGIVFIYNNGTLSNVYNTAGYTLDGKDHNCNLKIYQQSTTEGILERKYIKIDDNGWIDSGNVLYEESPQYLNSRGVCQLNIKDKYDDNTLFGIKFNIPDDVKKYLKEDLGIRGFFFVRQKCIPNILAQCYLLPMDEVLQGPILEYYDDKNNRILQTECFVSQDEERNVQNNYINRLYKKYNPNSIGSGYSKNAYAAICPDFLLNQPYYNQIFNSSKFRLQKISYSNSRLQLDTSLGSNRYYVEEQGTTYTHDKQDYKKVTICSVTEDVPSVAIENKIYKLNMGECEESFRFKYADIDNGAYDAGQNEVTSKKDVNKATNLVRGIFSPYLAIYSDQVLETNQLYNIFQETTNNDKQEFQIRMDSSEPFYAISDRYNFTDITNTLTCWRGDCYINNFAYRLNRNFNDPSLPNNDTIIEPNTWKNNYDINDTGKWTNISRSDLNAVQMGSWIILKVRSAQNYALRSEDHSYVSEEALMGAPRSYYPRRQMMWRGEHKLPDSYLYNDAYRATLGYKCYFTMQDVNYIKDTFSNRIQYSAMAIQDSYKNNYRYSLSTYFRDYSSEYGSITKLVGFEGYLLVVFEHAIGIAVINERVLAGQSDGEPVFINTANVLPEELTIITDSYGSEWSDSVIKSEAGYVYGVDTIAKKIWRVKGQQIEIISDFKVNKFLVDNITLSEREKHPTVGLKNVKTHYNNNKKDVMFTFYDDVYKDEEKVWNLCYNELFGEFITFYSWIPSFSENIDTQFFTFNRETSKELALLAKSNYQISENTGVLLEIPIFTQENESIKLYYRINETISFIRKRNDNTIYYEDKSELSNVDDVTFELCRDHWGFYKYFEIENNKLKFIGNLKDIENKMRRQNQACILLMITPKVEEQADGISYNKLITTFKSETIAVTFKDVVENIFQDKYLGDDGNLYSKKGTKITVPDLTTDFYLHGQAGIFDFKEGLYPTYWYGEQHPFEFEFVVNDKVGQQKIFTNLEIISNKAEPESFHFEIEGDNYDFSMDKRNMYFRQEATKNLYQNLGSNILYDRKFTDVAAHKTSTNGKIIGYSNDENYYRRGNYNEYGNEYPQSDTGLVRQVKSSIFPLYYERIDTYNDIYHQYREMNGVPEYDFKNLSGSEIIWYRDLNQFNVVTHIKNSPIDLVGRLRGNSRYNEGKWRVQIPTIVFNQKNESEWVSINKYNDISTKEDNISITNYGSPLNGKNYKIPPIVIDRDDIPTDLDTETITLDKLPNIYQSGYKDLNGIQLDEWTARKEAKIRDKWMKVRVRYSGKNLAIIHSIITLYNISYG